MLARLRPPPQLDHSGREPHQEQPRLHIPGRRAALAAGSRMRAHN